MKGSLTGKKLKIEADKLINEYRLKEAEDNTKSAEIQDSSDCINLDSSSSNEQAVDEDGYELDEQLTYSINLPHVVILRKHDTSVKDSDKVRFKCITCGVCWFPKNINDKLRDKLINHAIKKSDIGWIRDRVKCPNEPYHSAGYPAEFYKDLRLTRTLKEVSEQLYNEYDREKNFKDVEKVQIADPQVRRWICPICGNGWKASVAERYDIYNNKVILNCRRCNNSRKHRELGLQPREIKSKTDSLIYNRPELLMYLSNNTNDVDVYKVYKGSKYSIHWKCFRCGYEFDKSPVNMKYSENICPACGRRLVKGFNDYKTLYPEFSLDYFEANNPTGLDNIHYKSRGLLHWKCHTCNHTFMISPLNTLLKHRTCTVCNTIENRWKHLLDCIDTSKIQIDTAKGLRGDSPRKVGWVCERGHKYDMRVIDRTQNFFGCPYCRRYDWSLTDLMDSLMYLDIDCKIIDKLGEIPTQKIENHGNLTGYIQIGKVAIQVIQMYGKVPEEETVNVGKNFERLADEAGLGHLKIIEVVNQIETDLKFDTVTGTFTVPLNMWAQNNKYTDAIAEWIKHFYDVI